MNGMKNETNEEKKSKNAIQKAIDGNLYIIMGTAKIVTRVHTKRNHQCSSNATHIVAL